MLIKKLNNEYVAHLEGNTLKHIQNSYSRLVYSKLYHVKTDAFDNTEEVDNQESEANSSVMSPSIIPAMSKSQPEVSNKLSSSTSSSVTQSQPQPSRSATESTSNAENSTTSSCPSAASSVDQTSEIADMVTEQTNDSDLDP